MPAPCSVATTLETDGGGDLAILRVEIVRPFVVNVCNSGLQFHNEADDGKPLTAIQEFRTRPYP